MKKTTKPSDTDDMLPEYDFRGGVRGKYVARYPGEASVVSLDPDVAAVFKDSEAVNTALRALLKERSDKSGD
jgi:hypothetical protein